jgi:hypothetical protein
MMDRPDYKALLDAVSQARRNAWNTVPRDSNDHLEAGMFLAMFDAAFTYMRDHPPPAAAAPVEKPAVLDSALPLVEEPPAAPVPDFLMERVND